MTATKTLNFVDYTSKVCPRCSSAMELEVGSLPKGELNWFHIDVYHCPTCGRKSLGGPFFG